MKKRIVLVLMILLVLPLAISSYSVESVEKVQVSIARDMSFEVDGSKWQPYDVDGTTPLYPIIYNGRSYVPARALLENEGIDVGYDAAARRIILKRIDKASPLLYHYVKPTGTSTPVVLDFVKPDLEMLGAMTLEQSSTFNVADDATIWVDGKLSELSLEEWMKADPKLVESGKLTVDRMTGKVSRIDLVSATEGGSGEASRISITITISGPPIKIVIVIRF